MTSAVDVVVGVPLELSPLVRRLTCPNPGVMTGPGTNTYLIGHDEVTVIDPGPDDAGHLDAIAEAGGDRIRWIVVTHTHPDHAPGAEPLRSRLRGDVTVLGFVERDGFVPDAEIGDGHVVGGDEYSLRAVHTPGHARNHLCFLLEDEGMLFSGDHIMNGSTVVIGPPDGDMAEYLRSLQRVRDLAVASIAPAHGRIIDDPTAKIDEYVHHRLDREAKVVEALAAAAGPATLDQLVRVVYADVDEARFPIARRSLWAHLRKLADDGRAAATNVDDDGSSWEIRAAP